ncbi:restriction endonuclease subunit S [Enterococcus faecalis]|uniref:restriction endonuclease subunit S n=1 Tax=Enterococcus faecalis TaxID=1351 RepID=UPI0001B6FF78|nr:restriction endonuclease subunit S [Enterococcus faecalis]AUC59260.1 restriction endonuclease subunit S [Enterococcus faecalis ARO1/DG]EEU88946.1 restriction endonuclease S subunit [Enterococcus faecalis ARO1/DG]EGO2688857.1 restriction endonuclease subunit S [Enterococcus faecalis]EGO6040419.1 restriction endonuclease subunit S [Enterococcus faecalis]EGO7746055.1 restriction endonuclease subunit S [Enterococcus faecalis]
MREEMKKVPRIRFRGFQEDWELCKLEEIVDVRSGRDYKHLGSGNIPVYGTGGYMLSVSEALSYDEDAIGIGRKGTINNPYILKAPFWTVDTLFYTVPKNNFDLNFIYSIFRKTNWKSKDESTGVPSLSKTTINAVTVYIPSGSEQQRIGKFFKQLDDTITLHQRKLDQLKELKKAYLQLMFPVKDERVPKLRFADFEEEWELRKLGDITKISTGKLDANAMVENGKYDFYTSGIKKYRIDVPAFEGPAITIAGNGATVGYMHLADNKFNAYQRTYVLQKFVVDRSFLFSEVGNKLPKKINQEARTGNIPYIVMDMLTELKLSIPQDEAEQSKIGSFFKQIDKTIALHQKKLEQLKDLKTSYLQNMFI